MSLFKKKQKEVLQNNPPQLTELPKLPELPKMLENQSKSPVNISEINHPNHNQLPNLPSFPNNAIGKRFSQNKIKQVITGEKEDDFEHYEDEDEEIPKRPIRKSMTQEYDEPIHQIKKDPVFIRLDKFQETMKIFNNAKSQISQIETMLSSIRKRKEEEEKELETWETNIQKIKTQIEKIDKEVFSKVE